MKKLIILLTLIPAFAYGQAVTAQAGSAYFTDKTDFFVGGNALNDSLGQVNFLLCFISNTRPESLLNTSGPFVAAINENLCDAARDTSKDSDKNSTSQASQQSSGGSGGGSSSKDAASKSKGSETQLTKSYNLATQTDSAGAMNVKSWVFLPKKGGGSGAGSTASADPNAGGDPFDAMDKVVYFNFSQTANPNPVLKGDGTPTSKFGDFTANYSIYANPGEVYLPGTGGGLAPPSTIADVVAGAAIGTAATDTAAGIATNATFNVGNGYLAASGNTISYKDTIFGALEVSVTFNSTGSEGVYVSSEGWGPSPTDANTWGPYNKFYAFKVNDSEKYYCTKLVGADFLQINYDADGFGDGEEPTAVSLTDAQISSQGYSTTETCYSSDVATAKKDVYRYGVYDSATGARHETTGGGFPIRADNPVSGKDDMFGWADYYGTWVDDYMNPESSLTGATWVRDDGSTDTTQYKVQKNHLEILKFVTSYSSLDSLDQVQINIYTGDPYWGAEYGAANMFGSTAANGGTQCDYSHFSDAGNTACYEEYKGYWDKATASFVFTHAMKWALTGNNQNPEVELSTPITISGANWYSTMTKNEGGWTDRRGLDGWSPETQIYYQISPEAINAPTSATASAGIKKETMTIVKDMTDVPDTLYCYFDCIDASVFNAVLTSTANALAGGGTDQLVDSGYFAATSDCVINNNGTAGDSADDWQECGQGNIVDNEVQYIKSSGKIYDTSASANNEMNIHGSGATSNTQAALASLASAKNMSAADALMQVQMKKPDYDATFGTWYTAYLDWAAETGPLVPASQQSNLECEKIDGNYAPRTKWTGTVNEGITRYCQENIWEGNVTEYYRISMRIRPQWELINAASSAKIVFSPPSYLILDPDSWTSAQTAASGISSKDAKKDYRLFYNGFGSYLDIPGSIFNTCTGTDLGEYYFGSWDDQCMRYLPRFTIPDGAQLTDEATSNTYIVKALAGDELLSPITAKGLDYTGLTKAILPDASNLKDMGPGGSDSIGTVPEKSTLINNGDTAVNHGTVVFDPSS